MGLYITAYELVTFHQPQRDDSLADNQFIPYLYVNRDFQSRADGMVDGHYFTHGATLRFRAGSYSGYNHWRDALCRAVHGIAAEDLWANYERWAGKPFVELIHFADNEGIIGPKTSAKLAGDFSEHALSVCESWAKEPWLIETYQRFSQAFALAAGGGVVEFS